MRGSRCQGAAQPGLHLRARDRVERAERLVQAEDGLAGEQRAQERDALAHAAGELVRVGGLESVQPKLGEQLCRLSARRGAR